MSHDDVFSRWVKVETLPRDGLTQNLEATPAERAYVADLNGLVDIGELKAHFVLKRSGKGVRVTGKVHAEITQTCVVSLEPFPATVDEEVDVRFAPPKPPRASADIETLAIDAEDEPDPIIDGKVDLGALATEFVALGLDPYPRKPGVAFAPPLDEPAEGSPFDALAEIAKKGL